MRMRLVLLAVWAAVVGPGGAGPARADFMLVPPGLDAGDQFRVVFLSSVGRDALPTDITVYDRFITDLAAAAGLDTYFGTPVTWQVLGSTASVSAISRVPLTSPGLYLLSGTKVADSGADLWDGTVDTGIVITEQRFGRSSRIAYTGTLPDGSASLTGPLGGAGGVPTVQVGLADISVTNESWISAGQVGGSSPMEFYGVSGILTVPGGAAVPAPAGITLVFAGLVALGGGAAVRRRPWRGRPSGGG